MRRSFLDSLRTLLGPEPGLAVIHSSLGSIAPPGFSKWDVLFGLDALIGEGWTLAFPAFTFSFCRGEAFDAAASPSETGVLAQWVLAHLPGAIRTPHPIYSFAVAGPRAGTVAACPSSTTFGADSPFALFERDNAAIVLLGCGWKYATQFHRAEEAAQVPYRLYKDFAGQADFGAGPGPVTARMFVRDLELDPANDFEPAATRLRAQGLIRRAPVWRGTGEAVQAADLARVCAEMLAADPLAYLSNAAEVARRLGGRRAAQGQPALKIAVLGSANLHLACGALAAELARLLPGWPVECREIPYGQLGQSLLDPASELRVWKPDIAILADRLEDMAGRARLEELDEGALAEAVDARAAQLAAFHRANGGWLLVHRFAALYPILGGNDLPEAMTRRLDSGLAGLEQLIWIDPAAEAAASPEPPVDFRLWHLGRFSYSEPFSRRLARRWAAKIIAARGLSARLLVLDLDNTLWGGVLGEDGAAALSLGGDYPGNAYLAFQRLIKSLAARGIALAVCSKNDEDLALKAMAELPDMAIRPDDLAGWRINWRPKWENISALAAELNLGLDSLLFIDDNPAERESVRRNLPGVKILDLPADPAQYAQALAECPWVEAAAVTDEDRRRAESYKARRAVEASRAQAASLEDFYAGLGMTLRLAPLGPGNIARAAQLCAKTNQFNTTTRRLDQAQLSAIADQGGEVVVIGLEDRQSPAENIGLLVLLPESTESEAGRVDLYLLSCRVLGRGLETAILAWARGRAARLGWRRLRGQIIETERNTPARGVFAEAGFTAEAEPGWWTASAGPQPLPAWLAIADQFTDGAQA